MLFQRPIIMIVYSDTPASFIAIAAPEQSEWQPISSGWKPSLSLPTDAAAALSLVLMWADVISIIFSCVYLSILDVILTLVTPHLRDDFHPDVHRVEFVLVVVLVASVHTDGVMSFSVLLPFVSDAYQVR